MALTISNIFSSLVINLILLLINPLGSLMIMMFLLYSERTIIRSIKEGDKHDHAVHIKIRGIS